MTPHPAPYHPELLPVFADLLAEYGLTAGTVLDPFAGTGRIMRLRQWCPQLDIIGIEIEPEWAALSTGVRVGNALALDLPTGSVDAVITSPVYGNRMADHHEARDGSPRHTYRHALGRPLQPQNAGALPWGPAYRAFHVRAWREAYRVLRPGGLLILNLKNHIRRGVEQDVTFWHVCAAQDLGFRLLKTILVALPGQRHGAHARLRCPYESVSVLRRP